MNILRIQLLSESESIDWLRFGLKRGDTLLILVTGYSCNIKGTSCQCWQGRALAKLQHGKLET